MDYADTFNSMFEMDFAVAQSLVAQSVALQQRGEPQTMTAAEAFEYFIYA